MTIYFETSVSYILNNAKFELLLPEGLFILRNSDRIKPCLKTATPIFLSTSAKEQEVYSKDAREFKGLNCDFNLINIVNSLWEKTRAVVNPSQESLDEVKKIEGTIKVEGRFFTNEQAKILMWLFSELDIDARQVLEELDDEILP